MTNHSSVQKIQLPDNVIAALRGGQKIEAIKLLCEQGGIELKQAKAHVDDYLSRHEHSFPSAGSVARAKVTNKIRSFSFLGMLGLAAFMWAVVTVVDVVGSAIVLWHHDSYREATFTVSRLHYDDDFESGLTWGLIGNLPDGEARMYAPAMANAKALDYQQLSAMYPPGMRMQVWYNPAVTDTLFQHRTLRVIPHTPDLVASELESIKHWLVYCVLPLLGILLIARLRRDRTIT